MDDASLDDYIPVSVVSSTSLNKAPINITNSRYAPSVSALLLPRSSGWLYVGSQLQVFASYFVYGFLSLFAAMGLQQSASSFPTASTSLANTQSISNRSINPPAVLSARRDTNTATNGPTAAAATSSGSVSGSGSFGYIGYVSGASSNSSSLLNLNGLREKDRDRDSARGSLHHR